MPRKKTVPSWSPAARAKRAATIAARKASKTVEPKGKQPAAVEFPLAVIPERKPFARPTPALRRDTSKLEKECQLLRQLVALYIG